MLARTGISGHAVRDAGGRRLMAAALAVAFAAPAMAGQLDDHVMGQNRTAEDVDKVAPPISADGKLVAVPVPVVNPTIGYGVAPTVLYTFSADPANPGTPRSTVAAVAGYTSSGSWFGGAGFKLYLDQDRYRVGVRGGYGTFNVKFYGFGGGDVLRDHPIDLELSGPVAEAVAQARIFPAFYLGLKLRWADPTATVGVPVDFLPSLSLRTQLVGLGPVFEYDTRDSTWYPTRGGYGTLDTLRYDKAGIADARFWLLDGSYARYHTLFEDVVVAGQVRAAYAGEGAPFFMLPYISLRGLPAGLFLAPDVVQAQAELRWEIADRVGVVGFGGGGAAFGDYLGVGGTSYAAAGGVGVRYRVSQVDKMNIGFDVAVGTDANVSVYFSIGEAF